MSESGQSDRTPRLLNSKYIEGEPFWFLHEHNDGQVIRHDISDLCKELRVIPPEEDDHA